MKYFFPFVFLLSIACKKEKNQNPDGYKLPGTAASLTGVWQLSALYGSDGGSPYTWIRVAGGALITFTADSEYTYNKLLGRDRYMLSIYGKDTILKIYKKGTEEMDTISYFHFDVFANTLYLYKDGFMPSWEKYTRQQH